MRLLEQTRDVRVHIGFPPGLERVKGRWRGVCPTNRKRLRFPDGELSSGYNSYSTLILVVYSATKGYGAVQFHLYMSRSAVQNNNTVMHINHKNTVQPAALTM